jgi:hypothetical protein
VNRSGGLPGRKAGHALTTSTALGGAAAIGIVGATGWASSSGQTGLAIVLAVVGAFGAAARAVVPQNSRDRVEWTRVILDYRLHRARDRAAARLDQQQPPSGVRITQLPQNTAHGRAALARPATADRDLPELGTATTANLSEPQTVSETFEDS